MRRLAFDRPGIGPLSAILAMAFLCLLFPGAAAAEGSLEVLQVGWDGTLVPGSWNPVKVRVTGGGADATAVVEVVMKARYQAGPQTAPVDYPIGSYGQETALPAGVAKELTIWVPADTSYGPQAASGTVRLSAGGQLLAEQAVEYRSSSNPFWPMVGVLAESPSVARAISRVELPYQGLPVPLGVARLSAGDIPPMAERLGALKALVVQGSAPANLTGEQRLAVQRWVAAGGHLLIAGGPDAPRAAGVLPAGALPLAFTGSDPAADLLALGRWSGAKEAPPMQGPAARFTASSGTLLAGTSDRPMAWRLGLGQGTVTLLAVDPGLDPLANWGGAPALMARAMEPAMPGPSENEKMRVMQAMEGDVIARLSGALDALPPDAFPGWQMAALILGGFALLAGPLVHLGLSRFDRRVWIWLAVPAIALLLSSILYLAGMAQGGRDVLVNVISYLRLDEGGQSQHTLLAGFYAPTHEELKVSVPGGDVPVRTTYRADGPTPYMSGISSPATISAEPPFRIIGGRETRVEFESGQWSMRSVSLSRGLGTEAGKVTGRLTVEEGLIKGTLKNETPYLLEDAAVAVGSGLVKLGSLAPGQTAQVVLDPAAGQSPAMGYYGGPSLSWRLFGRPVAEGSSGGQQVAVVARSVSAVAPAIAVPGGPGMPVMPEQLEIPRDPEVQRRIRLMDSVMNKPRMGPGMPVVPLTFLAFTTSPIGKDSPTVGSHPTYHLAFVEQPLKLSFPPGPFSLPPSLVTVDMVEQTGGMGGGSDGKVAWMELRGGSVIYAFQLSIPDRARPEVLILKTQQMGPSSQVSPGGMPSKGVPAGPSMNPIPAEAGLFALYNWQSGGWDPLPAGQDQTRVQPAAGYVGPDGSVKARIQVGPDRSVMYVVPELSVEGRVEE